MHDHVDWRERHDPKTSAICHQLDYGVTKTAQLAVSREPAEAVAGTGVTVDAVRPGPTRSEILGHFMAKQVEASRITQDKAEQGFLKAMRPTRLNQRFATTDEVANMIGAGFRHERRGAARGRWRRPLRRVTKD